MGPLDVASILNLEAVASELGCVPAPGIAGALLGVVCSVPSAQAVTGQRAHTGPSHTTA